ncbi:hypothetical protein Tco_0951900 [Tanacetum coccineum]|uniref:Uncharacterized protein n=1 Tax=Tanacetum coccineum TaxID=301880 RepID=A0ABQ5DVJ7_9ASTR
MKKMMEAVITIRKRFVKMKFLMAVRLRDLWCLDVEVDVRSDQQLVEKSIGGSDWISVVTGECQLGLSEIELENLRQP